MRKIKLLGLAAALATFLLVGSAVQAASYAGQLVKGSGAAIYYVTKDNERLVFPDETTYKTWYSDFRGIIKLQDSEINQMPLVGIVSIKPGTKMIKAAGDNHIYAVARYGVKRLVVSPSVARTVYGKDWSKRVVTVSPVTLAKYVPGGEVAGYDQFWWWKEEGSVKTIDDNYEPTLNGSRRLAGTTIAENAQLTLKAVVINGTDGRTSATDSDTRFFIESLPVRSGQAMAVKPGDYTIYDATIPGYVSSGWSGGCNQSASDPHAGYVHLNIGEKKTCTVTYTYSLDAWKEPILTASVKVINDAEGKLIPDDFRIFVGSNYAKSGEWHQYSPKGYTLTVTAPPGQSEALYTPLGWTGDCNADGYIEMERGRSYNCVFTWDDVAPKAFHPTMGQLVLNFSGLPTDLAKNVRLFIEGGQVPAGQVNDVDPRDYTVYATEVSGYKITWGGSCLQSTTVSNAGTVKGEVLKLRTCLATYTKK